MNVRVHILSALYLECNSEHIFKILARVLEHRVETSAENLVENIKKILSTVKYEKVILFCSYLAKVGCNSANSSKVTFLKR